VNTAHAQSKMTMKWLHFRDVLAFTVLLVGWGSDFVQPALSDSHL